MTFKTKIEVVPTAVVASWHNPPELEIRFDMIPSKTDFKNHSEELPINWVCLYIMLRNLPANAKDLCRAFLRPFVSFITNYFIISSFQVDFALDHSIQPSQGKQNFVAKRYAYQRNDSDIRYRFHLTYTYFIG